MLNFPHTQRVCVSLTWGLPPHEMVWSNYHLLVLRVWVQYCGLNLAQKQTAVATVGGYPKALRFGANMIISTGGANAASLLPVVFIANFSSCCLVYNWTEKLYKRWA